MKPNIVPLMEVPLNCFPTNDDRGLSLYNLRCSARPWHGLFLLRSKYLPVDDATFELANDHQGHWFVGRIISNHFQLRNDYSFEIFIQLGHNEATAYYGTTKLLQSGIVMLNALGEEMLVEAEDKFSEYLIQDGSVLKALGLEA